MFDIPSSERTSVLIPAGYYCDECRIPYSQRKGIGVFGGKGGSIGLIDFNVDNDTPTSSTAVMNGFEFQKYAGIYLMSKNFGSFKALEIKEECRIVDI